METDDLDRILRAQYIAIFQMLRNALDACPDELWNRPDSREAPFWAQALHAIASTHFYLIDEFDGAAMNALSEALARDLQIDAGHGTPPDVPRLRKAMEELTRPVADSTVLDRAAMLRHLEAAESAALSILARPERFMRPNIMPWSGPTLADRLVYNLRHAQHHIGRLHSILGRNEIHVPWVMGDFSQRQ